MNKVILLGRLTAKPELRYTPSNNAYTRFSVAVNRRFKNAEGNYDADFINCVAFGKSAEFVEKYFKKGMAIGLTGRIQTGNYTNKDGQKVYTTDVVVEETEFVESKGASSADNSNTSRPAPSAANNNDFMSIPDGVDEELPFA